MVSVTIDITKSKSGFCYEIHCSAIVVRLDDHTPAHRTLSQVAAARTGSHSGPGWRRRPGRLRHSWIQQIGDGTPFIIRAEWSKARRRGHSGLTQRTCCLRDLMMMMMMVSVGRFLTTFNH